jgi:hypothetical protein
MRISKVKSILIAGLLGLLIGLLSNGVAYSLQPDYQSEYSKFYETYRGKSLGTSDREKLKQAQQEYQQAIASDPDVELRQQRIGRYRVALNVLAIILAVFAAWWCRALPPAAFSLAATLYAACGLLVTWQGGAAQQGLSIATTAIPVLIGVVVLLPSYLVAHFMLSADGTEG